MDPHFDLELIDEAFLNDLEIKNIERDLEDILNKSIDFGITIED